jgi:hypothetical protein
MSFRKVIKREIEVAFSKKYQSNWVRICKYLVLGIIIYFFRGNRWLWIILLILFLAALTLHFWIRYKTKGWTKSYGRWKADQNLTEHKD